MFDRHDNHSANTIMSGILSAIGTFAVTGPASAQPTVDSYFELPSMRGEKIVGIAVGASHLAGIEQGAGLTIWHTYNLTTVADYDKDDYPGQDSWKGAESITITPDDGNRIFLGAYECAAIFQIAPYAFTYCSSAQYADETSSFSPDGAYIAVIAGPGSDANISDRLDLFSGSTACYLSTLHDFPGDENHGGNSVKWSPNNDKIAYTWYDQTDPDDPGWLYIKRTSDFLTIEEIDLTNGSRVGDVAWSPDGSKLAAHDSDDFLRIFSATGGELGEIETATRDAGSIAWSPDGQYIAVHLEISRVSIYDAMSHNEIARLSLAEGMEKENESIAWRDDSKVLFGIAGQGSTEIQIFAPFDTTIPSLFIFSPVDGSETEDPLVLVQGSCTDVGGDNAGLHPDSLTYNLDDAAPVVIPLDPGGNFEFELDLGDIGSHTLHFVCLDLAGNLHEEVVHVEVLPSCPADFDDDGDVDTADLLFLLGAWGTPDGDVDGDGDTNTSDLLALLGAWGQCP